MIEKDRERGGRGVRKSKDKKKNKEEKVEKEDKVMLKLIVTLNRR